MTISTRIILLYSLATSRILSLVDSFSRPPRIAIRSPTTSTLLKASLHSSIPDPSRDRRQQSLNVGNNPLLSLNLNLDALAQAQAAERAQELYQRISALHREGYYAVSPDVVSFNSVLKAWQDEPSRALEFWEQEVDQLSVQNKPNVRSYNTFLLSLANAGLYESAESLLQQMQSPDSAVIPDRISYNTVLLSYVLSPEPSAASRAENLLQEMIQSEDVEPDIVSYNTLIATWAAHRDAKTAARKAETWLENVKKASGLTPDVYTYTTVLQAWARCGRGKDPAASAVASSRARELLQEMQTAHLVPNCITFTIVMQVLCENGHPEEAHEVLQDMLQKADAQPELRPDVVAFSALLDGYAKQAANKPKTALAACKRILDDMKRLTEKWPDVAPNERTYTSIFSALARSRLPNAGKLAEEYLQEMWESETVMPSIIHYNAVLDVYAKSPLADKAVRANYIWKDMQEKGFEADFITYNTLLATTSNVFGPAEFKKHGLRMGLQVFQSMQDDTSCRPTTLTYHYWFKTIRKLMPESSSREKVVKQAFKLCCDQGCLNDMVLSYVLDHLISPSEVLGDEFSTKSSPSVRELPPEWSQASMRMRKPTGWKINSRSS